MAPGIMIASSITTLVAVIVLDPAYEFYLAFLAILLLFALIHHYFLMDKPLPSESPEYLNFMEKMLGKLFQSRPTPISTKLTEIIP